MKIIIIINIEGIILDYFWSDYIYDFEITIDSSKDFKKYY